jgi:glycerol-3-phosphate dehydrogenase
MDSIKFYTRAQMGRCQGGFCSYKIMKILMRETGMSIEEITKRGAESRLITERVGALTVRPPAPPAETSGREQPRGEADQ